MKKLTLLTLSAILASAVTLECVYTQGATEDIYGNGYEFDLPKKMVQRFTFSDDMKKFTTDQGAKYTFRVKASVFGLPKLKYYKKENSLNIYIGFPDNFSYSIIPIERRNEVTVLFGRCKEVK